MTINLMKMLLHSFIVLLLKFAVVPSASATQYIVVNLHPSEINDATFSRIAALDDDDPAVRVGAGAIFSYLNGPHEKVAEAIANFLTLSQAHKVPVVVQLDGEQWWGHRPDLWNWWDETKPGYDPENRHNVEWTAWSPEHAMKIAWRNWGQQIRVLPPPNLMSPDYRAACAVEMKRLVPQIMAWYTALPESEKDLFIALKLGWESSIGVNAFYYPGGNALLDKPASDDPTHGIKNSEVPHRGVRGSGYAAIKTLGLKRVGKLKEAHQVTVVQRHLEDLCKMAHDLDVPRERLFTHVGGWKEGELLFDAALNPYASPGWSFYHHARDPKQCTGSQRGRANTDAPWWAAVEWLPLGVSSQADWESALGNTLSVPKCRYLCIYNWRGIAENEHALKAIQVISGKQG